MSENKSTCTGYLPIADYALIGDCHSAALVGRNGGIDWFCPGRFDAPSTFCGILDANRGGSFSVTLGDKSEGSRRYLGDTNVLETTLTGENCRVRLVDFMPITKKPEQGSSSLSGGRILRRIEAIDGDADLDLTFAPTFDYGCETGDPKGDGKQQIVLTRNGEAAGLALSRPAEGTVKDGVWHGCLRLKAGDCIWAHIVAGKKDDVQHVLDEQDYADALQQTCSYWEDWAKQCTYQGTYRSEVMRSALTLKLLTYEPTGAVVAAPTTSLPEWIGGPRNWDYRFTWLRDSSLILYALLTVGYEDEAADFLNWLRRTVGPKLKQYPQIMYTIDGGADITEKELKYLSGYCDSPPVRIGNAAAKQTQLDIYGEVMISAYIHYHHPDKSPPAGAKHGIGTSKPDEPTWKLLRALVDDAVREWKKPDEGIWEVRGGPQDFVYSKLMCWTAVDRGIRLAEEHHLEADLDHWKKTRDEIRHAIETKGYNEKLGAFVQAFGSDVLDAATLAIPRVGFLPATDKRVTGTIDQIQKHLMNDDLVYRYLAKDGLPGKEGTFLLCTWWLVDALALSGRTEEAHDLFTKTVARANDVGLFSEEIDASNGAFLGNFPQGFTHLGLIRSAVDLAKIEEHGPEHEAHTEGERAHQAHQASKKGGKT